MTLEDIREKVLSAPFFGCAKKNLTEHFKVRIIFGRRELWYYNNPFVAEIDGKCVMFPVPEPFCPSFDNPRSKMIQVFNYCASMCQHQGEMC